MNTDNTTNTKYPSSPFGKTGGQTNRLEAVTNQAKATEKATTIKKAKADMNLLPKDKALLRNLEYLNMLTLPTPFTDRKWPALRTWSQKRKAKTTIFRK